MQAATPLTLKFSFFEGSRENQLIIQSIQISTDSQKMTAYFTKPEGAAEPTLTHIEPMTGITVANASYTHTSIRKADLQDVIPYASNMICLMLALQQIKGLQNLTLDFSKTVAHLNPSSLTKDARLEVQANWPEKTPGTLIESNRKKYFMTGPGQSSPMSQKTATDSSISLSTTPTIGNESPNRNVTVVDPGMPGSSSSGCCCPWFTSKKHPVFPKKHDQAYAPG